MSKPKTGEIKFKGLGRVVINPINAKKKNAAKLTWSGKIIYLGDDLYAMVPINRPYKHGKKI